MRVVITGIGTCNALGANQAQTLAAMAAGRAAIGPLVLPDLARLSIQIGAQIRDFPRDGAFDALTLSHCDRFSLLALAAAQEAVTGAGLTAAELTGAGAVIGSAAGGIVTSDESYRAVYAEGKNRVPPMTVPRLMINGAASQIARRFGLQGPGFAVSSACASSAHAIAEAYRLIRQGASPVMLAGGAEAMLTFGGLKAWEGLRVMSADGCRPFCTSRSGMVMGEGAAVFVLEARAHALARGAQIEAEICGVSTGFDPVDLLAPSRGGAARAMREALQEAQIAPEEIGYINAHGTGTRAGDRIEAEAIREVFAHGDGPAVSSTKSLHGHAIGASGAIELLAVILALREGIIAPTAGVRSLDPACPIDLVANEARRRPVAAALSNSFAFGGMNAVLALRRTA